MTTPAAAQLYLAQHEVALEGRRAATYNPHNRPLAELPTIFGFNNGGSAGWYSAVALAEDGVCLGGHVCSHEGYMPADLGVLEGTRLDRHAEDYQKHYPDGYRMEFVPTAFIAAHAGLKAAIDKAGALNATKIAEQDAKKGGKP